MKALMRFLLVLTVFLGGAAFADDQQWNQHEGLYAELNAGPNFYYAGIFSSTGSAETAGIQGFGWSGALGYDITHYFAMETGFMQNYAKIKVHNNGDDDEKYQYAHTNIPYVTTRFNVPIYNRFSFIGKLGAMYLSVPTEGGMVLPFVGIGASYAVTPKLAVQAQYQGAVYGIAGAGLASLGLVYHFG